MFKPSLTEWSRAERPGVRLANDRSVRLIARIPCLQSQTEIRALRVLQNTLLHNRKDRRPRPPLFSARLRLVDRTYPTNDRPHISTSLSMPSLLASQSRSAAVQCRELSGRPLDSTSTVCTLVFTASVSIEHGLLASPVAQQVFSVSCDSVRPCSTRTPAHCHGIVK